MNPDSVLVHIDDEEMNDINLQRACRYLQVPPKRILWRKSVEGSLDLFRELAQTRQNVAAVVCNGEILNREDGDPEKDLTKHGGHTTFARYQSLVVAGQPDVTVREQIGRPPWVHHTNSYGLRGIIAEWNRNLKDPDLHAGAYKLNDDDRVLPVALAVAMFVRGVLPPEDPRVAWAIGQIQEDFRLSLDERKLGIEFAPWVHEPMRRQSAEWPYTQ